MITKIMRHRIYFGSDAKSYVLFLVGRVGSTYLTTLLNSHPDIYAVQEELGEIMEKGAQTQLDWTRDFLTPPFLGIRKVRGFSVKLVQILNPVKFQQLLNEKKPAILHMKRQNRIKAVVSYLNGRRLAEKTGMWGLFDEGNRLPPFRVDLMEFDKALKSREKVEHELSAYISTFDLPKITIYYENLLTEPDFVIQKVLTFLGVRQYQLVGKTLKNTSDDLRKVLENYDEIRAQYANTPYEAMFDEVLIP